MYTSASYCFPATLLKFRYLYTSQTSVCPRIVSSGVVGRGEWLKKSRDVYSPALSSLYSQTRRFLSATRTFLSHLGRSLGSNAWRIRNKNSHLGCCFFFFFFCPGKLLLSLLLLPGPVYSLAPLGFRGAGTEHCFFSLDILSPTQQAAFLPNLQVGGSSTSAAPTVSKAGGEVAPSRTWAREGRTGVMGVNHHLVSDHTGPAGLQPLTHTKLAGP